jgi:diguanylate cyclase (GGDEF)-like protein
MCDVDHFKQVNDRFGHGRGDDVLAALGAAVSSTLRASDFASRFGGEEFFILLPAEPHDEQQLAPQPNGANRNP